MSLSSIPLGRGDDTSAVTHSDILTPVQMGIVCKAVWGTSAKTQLPAAGVLHVKYLVFVSGPHKGNRVRLSGDVVRIGRDSANEIAIREVNASRHHAEFFLREGSYYIRDLGSTNGTKLNGVAIEESILKPGDQIAIGESVFVLEDKPKTHTTHAVTFSEGPATDESNTVRLDPSKSQFLDPKTVLARPLAAERLARLYWYI